MPKLSRIAALLLVLALALVAAHAGPRTIEAGGGQSQAVATRQPAALPERPEVGRNPHPRDDRGTGIARSSGRCIGGLSLTAPYLFDTLVTRRADGKIAGHLAAGLEGF